MIAHENCYLIGKLTKTHGLQGELVFNFSDDIFDTTEAEYLVVDTDGILVPFYIKSLRFRSSESALVKFEDIDSAEQSTLLASCDVWFEKDKAQEGNPDELSLFYFVGFRVVDEKQQEIGTITEIDDQTENWLFVVERPDGSEALIPAQEEFITDINHEKRVLEVDLPIGLLEL